MPGGARRGAGRKPVHIDVIELEKLCSLQCTDEEIAAFFGVSTRTIESRRKQRGIAEVMARGRAKGRISIRRQQMKLAEAGNPALAIYLGKALLGQREVIPSELSGPKGNPVRISLAALDAMVVDARRKNAPDG
jgi:hypothetical protein